MATPAAILSLLVKTEGAQVAAAQLRSLDSTARSTGRSLDRSSGAAEKHGKALRTIGHGAAYALGAGGFGGGLYALFDITKKSIGEFRESERVTRQTGAALKSTGVAANVTAKQVEGLANAIKRKTGIDDETIQSGENMLLTFTKIRNEAGKGNNIFDQATQAITDMSVAMNRGATPSAEQLTKTAILVGKALNDPIKGATALRRVGVALTQQQQDEIKTLETHGQHLQAQKIILRELTTEFGGSAEKQRTSAKVLSTAFGDLAESIGRSLVPLGNRVLPKITSGVERITNVLNDPRLTSKQKFDRISQMFIDAVSKGVSSAARLAANRAPAVAAEFVKGFAKANIWGQLAIGAFIVHRLGGWRKIFRAEGVADATAWGGTFAPTAAAESSAAGSRAGKRFAAGFRKFMVVGLAAALTVDLYNKLSGPFNDLLDKLGIGTGSAGPVAPGKHLTQEQADRLYGGRLPRNAPLPGLAPIPKGMRGVPAGRSAAISAAAARYGISPSLLLGVYGTETSYGANVKTSSAGAKGAFQFLKSTARQYAYPYTNKQNPSIFQAQANAAAHYLSVLIKQHGGNVGAALEAYSGGGYSSVPGGAGGGGKKRGAAGASAPADLAWAQRMVGHFKESLGSNRGPELNQLQKEFGTQAAAWCAEFATKALVKAGFPKSIMTARVADLNKWAKAGAKGLSFTTSPSPGDLMTIGNRHVGIVEKVNQHTGKVQIISGNTGKGEVSRSTYALSAGKYISTNAAGYTPFKEPSNRFKTPVLTNKDFLEFVQSRIDHFDLMVRAGLMSATKATRKKAEAIKSRLPYVTGDTKLELLAMLRELPAAATPAQKTWTPENKRRLAMAVIQANPGNVASLPAAVFKAAGVSATMQNPWLQAYQQNLTNQVGAGVLTQPQADDAWRQVLEKTLPFLTGQDAADVRTKLFEIATNTKDTARAALDTANSVRASGISDAQFLGGLTGPAAAAVLGALAPYGINLLPGGGSIAEIGNSTAAVALAQGDIATLMEEVNSGQVAFADVWPQILSDLGVIASGAEASSEASNAATDAVKALTDEVKRQTDFATSVANTESAAMAKWVTEVISKQMGFGIGGRGQTPGYGVARRT